ncbi:MAG TPA: hypothetical protein VHB25_14735 [Gemmatimonadaceae bacterium]|nr:hypothetical protein [Gemmatimonadaceae bacterium]
MSDNTPRREFLGQIAASAIVLAGTACAAPLAATQPAPTPMAPPPAPKTWDDSWFGRITTKHKAVFDSPEIDDGLAVSQAAGYINQMRAALDVGNDVISVLVIRHAAIPMAFNDAMWAKYEFGKYEKIKDERTKQWATRNPYLGQATAAAAATSDVPEHAQGTLSWLGTHGQILLGCDLATRGMSTIIAQRTNQTPTAVYEEIKANLVPGLILQPSGVYAVHRAQEAGCSYIRST